MWQKKLNVIGGAALLAAMICVSRADAAGIVNGNFETGDFTGWTVQGHAATPPVSPIPPPDGLPVPAPGTPYYGAQVLTQFDIFVDGQDPSVNPAIAVVPPEGSHYALLSSLPSGSKDPTNPNEINDEFPECPTTLNLPLAPPTDIDSDRFFERDVTILSQQFTVDEVPASIAFTWSYLAGEDRNPDQNWLHDNFQVTLTPISPPGAPIQLLGVTAGNVFNPAYGGTGFYTGTFPFIDPSQLDGRDYQVLTLPAGGPTDCHHSGFGRTSFRKGVFPIPSAGTWEVKFFVGDDGGDGLKTTGVLLDSVELNVSPHLAPALSSAGMVLVTLILAAVGIFGLASRGVRPRPANLLVGALLLIGTALLLSHSQAASGSLRPAATSEDILVAAPGANDEVAQTRRTPVPTLVPTRPPYATQTPIVS